MLNFNYLRGGFFKAIFFILLSVIVNQALAATAPQEKQVYYTSGVINSYEISPILIGGEINLPATSSAENTIILGGRINMAGKLSENAMVLGGNLKFASAVAGNTVLIGGNIQIAPQSSFGEDSFIMGGTINLAGNFADDLTIVAGKALINGTIHGDLDIYGGAIEIGPDAQVNGKLTYYGAMPLKVAQGATIKQGVVQGSSLTRQAKPSLTYLSASFIPLLLLYFAWFVFGVVLILFLPRFTGRALTKLKMRPWASLGWGIVILIITPIVLILLMITIIGFPLALALLFLYLITLFVGYIYGAVGVGYIPLSLMRKDVSNASRWFFFACLVLGLIILHLLNKIPYLGGWFTFLALLFGMGCFILALSQRYQKEERVTASSP